jgi:hypothetical protein
MFISPSFTGVFNLTRQASGDLNSMQANINSVPVFIAVSTFVNQTISQKNTSGYRCIYGYNEAAVMKSTTPIHHQNGDTMHQFMVT